MLLDMLCVNVSVNVLKFVRNFKPTINNNR